MSKNIDTSLIKHVFDINASQCYKSLNKAYFSFENRNDFDYFLNSLQQKINIYKKLNKYGRKR